MSRTKRAVNPRTIMRIKSQDTDPLMVAFLIRNPKWARRDQRILRGQDGSAHSEKRDRATIDAHGNWKLNTWTSIGGSKKETKLPQKQQRNCGRIIIRRAFEEMLENKQLDFRDWYYDQWLDPMDDQFECYLDGLYDDDHIDEPYEPFDDYGYDDWYDNEPLEYME